MVYITSLPAGGSGHYAAWALLRLGLMEMGLCDAGMSVRELISRSQKGEHGKPCLPGFPEFSISHSRGIAGCAIETEPVGLDIERVREFSPGMVGKICTEGERRLTGCKSLLLTQLWTCKESHMKLTGLGFSQGLRNTEFRSLGERPEMIGESARFYSTPIDGCFWLTLCCAGPVDFKIKRTDYSGL